MARSRSVDNKHQNEMKQPRFPPSSLLPPPRMQFARRPKNRNPTRRCTKSNSAKVTSRKTNKTSRKCKMQTPFCTEIMSYAFDLIFSYSYFFCPFVGRTDDKCDVFSLLTIWAHRIRWQKKNVAGIEYSFCVKLTFADMSQ